MVVVSNTTALFSILLLKYSVLLYSSTNFGVCPFQLRLKGISDFLLSQKIFGIRFIYWGKISDGGVCFGYAEALSCFQMTGDLRVSAANFA